MKKVISTVLLPGIFFTQSVTSRGQEKKIILKQKKVNKEYKVKSTDTLAVNSCSGNITIHTWDKNEVVITITENGRAYTAEKAQAIVDHINTKEERKQGKISLKTSVNTSYNSQHSIRLLPGQPKGKAVWDAGIDYVMYVPKNISLNIENAEGDVYLDDFTGAINIDIIHGCLHAKKLSGPGKIIKAFGDGGYGDHTSTITSIESGRISGARKLVISEPIDTTKVILSAWETIIVNGVQIK